MREMDTAAGMRSTVRKASYSTLDESPTLNGLYRATRRRLPRSTDDVQEEYGRSWASYEARLDESATLHDWLFIESVEGTRQYHNVDGKVTKTRFDHNRFNQKALGDAIERHFPQARSVTEYGCGLGRNLLAMKTRFPEIEFYGYELCAEGVHIAQRAAAKYGIEIQYAQLDYLNCARETFVFPSTDIAFTVHSLEQLPYTNALAIGNILQHVELGSIHIEPIPEKYPLSYWGVIGRIYHDRMNYVRNFDASVRSLRLTKVTHELLRSAANPLVYPSLYVLEK